MFFCIFGTRCASNFPGCVSALEGYGNAFMLTVVCSICPVRRRGARPRSTSPVPRPRPIQARGHLVQARPLVSRRRFASLTSRISLFGARFSRSKPFISTDRGEWQRQTRSTTHAGLNQTGMGCCLSFVFLYIWCEAYKQLSRMCACALEGYGNAFMLTVACSICPVRRRGARPRA